LLIKNVKIVMTVSQMVLKRFHSYMNCFTLDELRTGKPFCGIEQQFISGVLAEGVNYLQYISILSMNERITSAFSAHFLSYNIITIYAPPY